MDVKERAGRESGMDVTERAGRESGMDVTERAVRRGAAEYQGSAEYRGAAENVILCGFPEERLKRLWMTLMERAAAAGVQASGILRPASGILHPGAGAGTCPGNAAEGTCPANAAVHFRCGRPGLLPVIPCGEADLIISGDPGEAVRFVPFLKRGGTVRLLLPQGMRRAPELTASTVRAEFARWGYSPSQCVEWLGRRVGNIILIPDGENAEALLLPELSLCLREHEKQV